MTLFLLVFISACVENLVSCTYEKGSGMNEDECSVRSGQYSQFVFEAIDSLVDVHSKARKD